MFVEHFGDGRPALAVVACVHGDEICGKRALERNLTSDIVVDRPVSAVVANEAAVAAGTRFVDEDLNRAFPGDPDADTHEGRLAVDVLAELDDTIVLDLHSTVSTPEPFALFHELTPDARTLLAASGVEYAVDISHVDGGLIDFVDGIAVECGTKGSEEATDNAARIVASTLAAFGVVDGPGRDGDPVVFEVTETVDGEGFEFVGENFVAVEAGDVFAQKNGNALRATESFYPVLMSSDGYDDIIGFGARRRGRLSTLPDDPDD